MLRVKKEFFYPKSVAIFGPSNKRRYFWINSLIANGFQGAIFPIHPTKTCGSGLKFWKSVLDVPHMIDYAIIAVPAKFVLGALKDCVEKGIKFASIFSSGFSEVGSEGKELEQEIKEFVNSHDINVNGPNCMGIYCPKSGLAFRTDSHQVDIGAVSFVSQSGGIAINLVLRGQKQNLLFSKVISTGNGIDLKPAEYIEFLAEDPETRVIGVYLENLGKTREEGRQLFNALKFANKKKPVIIWRGGRTDMGAKAAASHTGALASNNKVWDAVIKQTGVISVRTFEELVDTLISFQMVRSRSWPRGPNVGLVSVSGGVGVTNSDLLSDLGLKVPRLTDKTIAKIEKDNMVTDVGVSPENPIDLGSSYYALSVVEHTILHLLEDDNIDSVIIEVSSHYVYNAGILFMRNFPQLFMEQIAKTVKKARKTIKNKPIMLTLPRIAYEQERILDRDYFVEKNIPVFDTVEDAGKAIVNLCHYEDFIARTTQNSD